MRQRASNAAAAKKKLRHESLRQLSLAQLARLSRGFAKPDGPLVFIK
jgi:hypothetical protein